jgi:UDP-N-acetylmuramate dehydrogenase
MELNKDLTGLNTFGIKSSASRYQEIHSEEEAELFFDSYDPKDKLLVLGGGSNILFTDNYDGIVLANRILGKDRVREDQDNVWLRIGAGENWHGVVEYCLKNNWGGIENLSLIPGCAGAAPLQNIGAYGVEIKDVLESVSGVVYPEGELRVFDNESCQFGYRDSLFKRDLKGKICITYMVLKLTKKHQLNTSYGAIGEELVHLPEAAWTIQDVSSAVVRIRRRKLPDPANLGNAGSFFKNPTISTERFNQLKEKHPEIRGYSSPKNQTKVAAGWLIEASGWKGKKVGNTGCHSEQALVLVNYGGASGSEILNHAKTVIQSVFENFGIQLEPEVNIVK